MQKFQRKLSSKWWCDERHCTRLYQCLVPLMEFSGVRRNFEKGFPLQLNDCYIRVVYLLEYLDHFTKIIIKNAISIAVMLETII